MGANEDFSKLYVGTGHVTRFAEMNLHTTETLEGFGTVLTQAREFVIQSPVTTEGPMRLAGGRKYNAWGLAGKRAPTTLPSWTQPIMFSGDAAACRRRLNMLMSRVGLTGDLTITYGRIVSTDATPSTGHFGTVICEAVLMSVTADVGRTLHPGGAKTWFVVRATWEQTGVFRDG